MFLYNLFSFGDAEFLAETVGSALGERKATAETAGSALEEKKTARPTVEELYPDFPRYRKKCSNNRSNRSGSSRSSSISSIYNYGFLGCIFIMHMLVPPELDSVT